MQQTRPHLLVYERQRAPHCWPGSSFSSLRDIRDLSQAQKVEHAAKSIRTRGGLKKLKLLFGHGALHLVHDLCMWTMRESARMGEWVRGICTSVLEIHGISELLAV